MRTVLIAALLVLTATPALAEADWVKVSESDDGIRTIYVNRSSIRTSGAIRRYWERTDYVNDPDAWRKSMALQESNCATGQTRLLQLTVYKVGGTTRALPASVDPWTYAPPGTIAEAVYNYVCSK